MDTLFARYFDGELSDQEAKEFLDAVESNPKLERELRTYEHVLTLGKKLAAPPAPAGFTRRVMTEVAVGGGPERRILRTVFFGPRLIRTAVAASIVFLAFTGGWWLAKKSIQSPGPALEATRLAAGPAADVIPVHTNQSHAVEPGYRFVRFVYAPRDPAVQTVHVAGNFNGWDPESTPLQRQDGVWSTMLMLPPGDYEYMFVIDERQWVTDPLAVQTRDDGFGGQNAVLEVEL